MSTEDLAARGDVLARAKLRDRHYQRRLRRILPFVLFLLALAVTYTTNYIPSSSMEPTLKPGDHIVTMRQWIAYPFSRIPSRGDVIIFRLPQQQQNEMVQNYGASVAEDDTPEATGALAYLESLRKNILIKRVVGLPGDSVQVTDNGVLINGKPMKEDYKIIPVDPSGGDFPYAVDTPFKVPPGCVFVLGDNRNNSEDSRFWGALPRSAILGKYICLMYHQDVQETTDPAAPTGAGSD
jgi:signal peptidase I